MIDRESLRKALGLIRDSSSGLRWVTRETGITEAKLRSFTGSDLFTPEDDALKDEEVESLLEWYYSAGPT